ncbi:hypothetical protein, partial [Dermacoccus nishinomiyaensis]|uniref:hypothetical protein n=1 Tax=Dermacoccus nishinomiyaensis TaxID=1274 RepID=UPI001C0BD935
MPSWSSRPRLRGAWPSSRVRGTSWVPVAGDYARHSTSHRAAVIGSYVGYSVTQIAVYCIGMVALVIA